MASAPRVSIIVIATSAGPRLHRCLERLASASPTVPYETIVVLGHVDASEPDPGPAGVRELRVERTEINLGFAGALNHGRSFASGELIVSLHDDAEVGRGWLEALVEAVDREPDVGAVGSLVLGSDQRVQAAGWELLSDGWTSPPWLGDPPEATDFDRARAVDYCPSCSLLVRASSWDRAGGADERFFPLYYVDVDLCLAIRARGERVLCEPSSVVVHHRGASTTPDFGQFVSARNRGLLLGKWGELITTHVPGAGATYELGDEALPAQDRAPDLATRERRALLRDRAVTADYAAALRSRLDVGAAELEATRAERDAHAAGLEVTRAERDALSAARANTRAELAELASHFARLTARAETLARIEAGGWWRLRSRLLPVLRLASAVRRTIRRQR